MRRRGARGARRKLVVREHDALTGLDENERRELERFALTQPAGSDAEGQPVLMLRNGRLHAQNYVGIVETRRRTVVEILPKIDLGEGRERDDETRGRAGHPGEQARGSADSSTGRHEDTRRVFLTMLRHWRRLGQAQLDAAGIRSVCRFDMLEAFVQLFAYGRRYGCRRVILVYPRTTMFREIINFRFVDDQDMEMSCYPFDVDDSAGTVDAMMRDLLC